MLYVGKQFTATLIGVRVVPLVCDQCRTAFCYELSRTGVGRASAPYYLFQGSAAARAEAAAERNLQKRLATESELVPCPKCHWVNQSLVDQYRRRLYRKLPWVAGGIAFLMIFFGVMLVAVTNDRLDSGVTLMMMFAALMAGVLPAVFLLMVQRQLRRRIDPNLTHPRRPTLPPGTPPALIEETDRRTGQKTLRPVHRQEDALPDAEWATLRAGQLAFPQNCCVCLETPRTIYKPPFAASPNSWLSVPLCEACASRLFWRWWGLALATTLLAVLVAAGVGSVVPGDEIAKWGVFGFIVLFGTILGVATVPNALCRPYRLKLVDADRGVIKFAAKNPLYTGLIAANAMAATKARPPAMPRRPKPGDVDRSPIPLE